jgi:hypothetical protein
VRVIYLNLGVNPKHEKANKNDGNKPQVVNKRSNKKTPPRFENHDGVPSE